MAATSAIRPTKRQAQGHGCSVGVPHTYALSLLASIAVVLFQQPLSSLASLSFKDERSSHVLLIPLISAFLIYLERKRIFRDPHYCPSIGVPLLLLQRTQVQPANSAVPPQQHGSSIGGRGTDRSRCGSPGSSFFTGPVRLRLRRSLCCSSFLWSRSQS